MTTCQCTAIQPLSWRCMEPVTQEDLLCDHCRDDPFCRAQREIEASQRREEEAR